MRTEKLWQKYFGEHFWSGFLSVHFTEEVVEFLSLYFKCTGTVSDDLVGEAESRFLLLAQSHDQRLHNIRHFTKTAKVIAAIIVFRNCTRPTKPQSIRKLLRSNYFADTKEMEQVEDEKEAKYGAFCSTAAMESFSKCLVFIATVLNAPASDICTSHDAQAAWSAIEELVHQLIARIADRSR